MQRGGGRLQRSPRYLGSSRSTEKSVTFRAAQGKARSGSHEHASKRRNSQKRERVRRAGLRPRSSPSAKTRPLPHSTPSIRQAVFAQFVAGARHFSTAHETMCFSSAVSKQLM